LFIRHQHLIRLSIRLSWNTATASLASAEYIEAAMSASGRKLVVVDQAEMKDDLVQDMVDALTSFCAPPVWPTCCEKPSRKSSRCGGFGDRG
jgi:hypothetical protein